MISNLHMDFDKRVVIETEELEWLESPNPQVLRKPLERENLESGHVTSVVKYEPGSCFKSHPHPLGEEIYVLDGVFSDESGSYPAGTYLRNPPGSSHSPYSEEGCQLFVKLNQFHAQDSQIVAVQTREKTWLPGHGKLKVMPLHSYLTSSTALVWWPAGEVFNPHRHYGGEEIFVLEGEFIDEFGNYPKGTWIRSPHLSSHHPRVERDTLILVKTGHLL